MTRAAVLTVLIAVVAVLLAIALLYAYRAQPPASQPVAVSAAVTEIQEGRVRSVVIEGNRATLTLEDGRRQEVTLAERDDVLARAVADFNSQQRRTPPIELRYQQGAPIWGIAPVGVLVSFLPLLLLVALILLLARALDRGRASRRYEDLARIADLRDRAVLTEGEFQREKRRLLRSSRAPPPAGPGSVGGGRRAVDVHDPAARRQAVIDVLRAVGEDVDAVPPVFTSPRYREVLGRQRGRAEPRACPARRQPTNAHYEMSRACAPRSLLTHGA